MNALSLPPALAKSREQWRAWWRTRAPRERVALGAAIAVVVLFLAWLILVLSGVLEAVWAVALGKTDGFTRLVPTVVFLVAITASMLGLAYAMRTLPVGMNDYIGQYGIRYGELMASSVMVSLPVIVIFFFLQRQFVAGLIGARVQEEGWLTKALAERAEQAAAILVELEANDGHLDLVGGFSEDQREQYWATVDSHRATDEATDRFVVGLLAAGRAFSAIDAVGSIREGKAPTATIVAVLQAVLSDSNIENVQVLRSPQHTVGALLDQLEDDGLPNYQLADLEWLYLPLLNEERSPRALHQRLADDPAFFAEVASHMYTPDPPESDQEVPEDEYQFIGACWDLIRGWSSPLPGATAGIEPDSETMQAWVSQARQELAQRNRAGIASGAIGAALGGRTTDAGDIWPCRAVREVLEHEQDDDLEDELAITRVNGRGVSTRGSYDGGRKERKLADKYRAAAADLRDEWPRTGKVLDRIVAIYESHARREDNTAERRVQE